MYRTLRIDHESCLTCDACFARKACNTRAIVQFERGDLPVIEASRCHGCMACVPACPAGAVVLEDGYSGARGSSSKG